MSTGYQSNRTRSLQRRRARTLRIEVKGEREAVRTALNTYEDMLVEAIQATDKIHDQQGGQKQTLLDLHASLTQVKSAKRVLWMD